MMFDRVIGENQASRERLRAFINGLSDSDLARPTPGGWTVAGVLAHLAFWDQRALVLLRRWKETGVSPSPIDIDVVNDATKTLCLAIEPHTAAQLCLAVAETSDRELAAIDQSLLREIEAMATQFWIDRAAHRNEHLDELEAVIAAGR